MKEPAAGSVEEYFARTKPFEKKIQMISPPTRPIPPTMTRSASNRVAFEKEIEQVKQAGNRHKHEAGPYEHTARRTRETGLVH